MYGFSTINIKREGGSNEPPLLFLFKFIVVSACVTTAVKIAIRRRGRRWRVPTAFSAALFSGKSDVDENDVLADLDDIFQIDKQFVFLKTEAAVARYDNAQPFVFGIAQRDIADPSEFSSVECVDDLFRSKFRKTQFHNDAP